VLARPEALRERSADILGFRESLAEGPASAREWLGEALDQRGTIGPSLRGRPQRIADRDLENGLVRVGRLVGDRAGGARCVHSVLATGARFRAPIIAHAQSDHERFGSYIYVRPRRCERRETQA
jgi:hypothetical protein